MYCKEHLTKVPTTDNNGAPEIQSAERKTQKERLYNDQKKNSDMYVHFIEQIFLHICSS